VTHNCHITLVEILFVISHERRLWTQGTMKCFECRGDHFRRNCPKLLGAMLDERKCYICCKSGHYVNSCPEKGKFEVPQQQQKTPREKPQAVGKVFAMLGAEMGKLGNLIQDTCFSV